MAGGWHWSRIVFSDESRFNLRFSDGRVRCWHDPTEANDPSTFNNVSRSNMSIIVWGCISIHGVGQLVIVEGNINQFTYIDVLEENLRPSIEAMFGDQRMPYIFMHDNAPCHKGRTVERYLEQNDIQRIDWPAQSPDASPVENLWSDISRAIIRDRPSTKDGLIRCVFRAWASITPAHVRRLYDSLPRRMRQIVAMRGYPTRY